LLSGATYLWFHWLRPKKPAPQADAKPAPSLSAPSGEMVLVPAGTFLSGESKEPIWLPAYYIDRIEVTNAVYAAFCRAAPHDLPPGFPPGLADYPVVNVTMADARAFAAWAGKRIPNGREWEKAARGERGQTFPWGEAPDRSRANIGLISLLPANAFPKGASPYGALQMIGNAWELIDDEHNPDERGRPVHVRVRDDRGRRRDPVRLDHLPDQARRAPARPASRNALAQQRSRHGRAGDRADQARPRQGEGRAQGAPLAPRLAGL